MSKKVKAKVGYFRTSKTKEKVPDSMLRCGFCGELNSDLTMTVVLSGETSAGNSIRQAHHKACSASYKRKRRIKQAGKATPEKIVDEVISLDFESSQPRKDAILQKIINSF